MFAVDYRGVVGTYFSSRSEFHAPFPFGGEGVRPKRRWPWLPFSYIEISYDPIRVAAKDTSVSNPYSISSAYLFRSVNIIAKNAGLNESPA